MAKDSLYSWQQMDLSPAESQTLLECRRQELLELLQDEDFSAQGQDEQISEWLSLMTERDRLLRCGIEKENHEKLLDSFKKLNTMLENIGRLDHGHTSLSLKGALCCVYKELRKHLKEETLIGSADSQSQIPASCKKTISANSYKIGSKIPILCNSRNSQTTVTGMPAYQLSTYFPASPAPQSISKSMRKTKSKETDKHRNRKISGAVSLFNLNPTPKKHSCLDTSQWTSPKRKKNRKYDHPTPKAQTEQEQPSTCNALKHKISNEKLSVSLGENDVETRSSGVGLPPSGIRKNRSLDFCDTGDILTYTLRQKIPNAHRLYTTSPPVSESTDKDTDKDNGNVSSEGSLTISID